MVEEEHVVCTYSVDISGGTNPATQSTPTQSSSHCALQLYLERRVGQWKWLVA